MPTQVRAALDRVRDVVGQFSLAQRTLAVLGVAVVVLGVVALSAWLSRPTMAPLFSGLSGADASAVVDQLEADGVQYDLADGGATVLVPKDQLYAERIAMASAGLPANTDGDGYSLLDDMPVTSSEFQQQTTYQRALEGELATTVEAMDGVEQASVRLALPKETVFAEEKQDPTASVFVRTRPGTTLTPEQVQAVVHLVSAGISGMKPADVSVVDSSGKVLSASGTDGSGQVAGQRTAEYEDRVRQALQGVLDQVVGVGNSAVTVTAELNFDETQRTSEQFSAKPNVPPLTSSTTEEQYTGTGAGTATGVLGPDNVQVPAGSGDGSYTSTSEDVQNAVDKVTEVTNAAPGRVERQSVAVVLDMEPAAGIDLAALQQTLAAAAGIVPGRGDTIEVQRMAFDQSAADEAAAALAQAQAQEEAAAQAKLYRELGIAAAVLVAAIVVIVMMVRRSRRTRRERLDLGELTVDEPPLLLDGGAMADATQLLPPVEVPQIDDGTDRKRAEIATLAEENPAEMAELLRTWMAGSGSGTGGAR
jgi:flagellar M-ring protein FliF